MVKHKKISKILNKTNTLIDLAADFRLSKFKEYSKWYGQNHKAKENISKSIYAFLKLQTKN